MTSSATQKTLRGLIGVAALFVLTIATMAFMASRLYTANASTLRTYQTIRELQDTLSALQDVETGNRGYCLTGKTEFLAPYESGKRSAPEHLAKLKNLLGEQSEDGPSFEKLARLAQDKIDFSADVIKRTTADRSAGVDIVMQGRGKKIMDDFRAEVKSVADRKTAVLDIKLAEVHTTQQWVWAVISSLSVTAALALIYVFRIGQNALNDERERVRLLNDEMEQRKKTERALKEATIRLSSSNTDLQQFAYVASHDLQEPLRAVSGFVQLLAAKNKDHFDEESLTWVRHAVEGSQRMRTLINDLLSYARIESRGKEFVTVDLNEVVKKVEHDLSVVIEETHTSISAEKLPTVMGDPTQMAQLFQNLISNGIKFHGESSPVITINSTMKDRDYIISVKDNGRGFDMEHAERIFVIFQRLQGRTEAAGTGIGLAVCKKIVERHHGRIWVESKVGEGTTFFFSVPIPDSGEKS
ncbi:MAG TPA: ATP-binding protein [Drouetiella sp.]